MKVPLSWLKDFVEISIPAEEVARLLTFAGMEVEDLEYIGLAPQNGQIDGLLPLKGGTSTGGGLKAKGLAWDPVKIVTAQILEVMPHPNADRLTLLRLDDGTGKELIVLTGAPNLFEFKGIGPLPKPIKVAYAREGTILYDGHKPGRELMILKRAKIRGVDSFSMVCSEKELGISEEHEGIILLDDDAPVGVPLADYMGDVVFEVKINPNMARNASILGLAREVAALTGQKLKPPSYDVVSGGPKLAGQVSMELRKPELNPRFVVGLIEGVKIGPSAYQIQRRLRLAGMRPISNIVDATNYVMLEVGQPLHAFDWDVLKARANGRPVKIITRQAAPGETLKTLDNVDRKLDDFTVLVCDEAGALSIAGVMGGAESEVSDKTTSVLLEGAAWEFINIRRTMQSQKLPSEASFRFSRGVHPAMAERGVQRGLEAMRQWSGGVVAEGLVDEYPLPAPTVVVDLTPEAVERTLGIRLPLEEIASILERLEFRCVLDAPGRLRVTAPDHRLDIGTGVVGEADLIEEVARIYGYERIPETQMSDMLPPLHGNLSLELEERTRDLLVALGLQEMVTYSLTSPEKERRVLPPGVPADARPYVTLANPIAVDRSVMRHSLLNSVLEIVAANVRADIRDRVAMFEIGPVYLAQPDDDLPAEPRRLAIALTGLRSPEAWQGSDRSPMDFFDLKGVLTALWEGLHLMGVTYTPDTHPTFMPGRTARLLVGEQTVGWLGELHPLVRDNYDLPAQAVLAAEIDLEGVLAQVSARHLTQPVPSFPPVKEDIAVIVDEKVSAAQVQAAIEASGGNLLTSITLFDLFRGEQIGAGKKSLAYRLTYQAPDRTLTDGEAAKVRARIVKKLHDELEAVLRG
jgi:phenylalanyl-tRNA synthetase beta chain